VRCRAPPGSESVTPDFPERFLCRSVSRHRKSPLPVDDKDHARRVSWNRRDSVDEPAVPIHNEGRRNDDIGEAVPIDFVHDSLSCVSLPLCLGVSSLATATRGSMCRLTLVFPPHRAGGALSALFNFKTFPFQTDRHSHAQPISGRDCR